MRVRLSAPDSKGPRVIPLIPDLRLCHLEGRNGIGKTLAARLLEIATGGQPFSAIPAAWHTLREQLGPVEIVVDEFEDGGLVLRFLLDPSEWPGEPDQLTDAERGLAWRNERPMSFGEVRQILRVARVGGEETLRQTVINQLIVRQVRAHRLIEALRHRRDVWDTAVDELAQVTKDLDADQLEQAAARTQYARDSAERAVALVAAAEATASLAQQAKDELIANIALIDGHPKLAQTIKEGRARLVDLNKQLDEANDELLAASAAIAEGEKAQQTLRKAENLRGGRLSRLRSSELAEQVQLRHLGFATRPTDAERKRFYAQASAERDALRARLNELDTTAPLQSLAAQLEAPLVRSVQDLGGQLIVLDPSLTVAGLLRGVRVRREQLAGQPRPGEVEELRQRDQGLTRRLEQLTSLPMYTSDTDRKRVLLRESEAELARLTKSSSADHLRHYQLAQERQAELRAATIAEELSIREAETRLEMLLQQAGVSVSVDDAVSASSIDVGTGLQALGARIEASPPTADEGRLPLLATIAALSSKQGALGAREQWANALAAAETWADSCSTNLESARMSANETSAELEDLSARLAATRLRLRQSLSELRTRKWAPLHDALDSLTHRETNSDLRGLIGQLPPSHPLAFDKGTAITGAERHAARICGRVGWAAEELAQSASEIARAAATAYAYLDRLVTSLQPHGARASLPTGREVTGEGELEAWLEAEFTGLFDTPELRHELFDDASEVEFALLDYTIRWRGKDGQWRRRPLEAFSSGEQAFAYTRAKLEMLKEETKATSHVMIVLDEFGAFVARDRLSHLLRFVEEEALRTFAEQAVVMLPLSRELPDTTTRPSPGEGPDPAEPEAKQVADWGYFCRDAIAVAR